MRSIASNQSYGRGAGSTPRGDVKGKSPGLRRGLSMKKYNSAEIDTKSLSMSNERDLLKGTGSDDDRMLKDHEHEPHEDQAVIIEV